MEHMSTAADGNLGKLLRSDVAPERGALIDLLPPRRAWTCGELDAAADAFADALTREGVAPDARVAILAENCAEHLIAYMLGYRRYLNALLYAGVTTVLDTGNVEPFIVQLRAEVAARRLPGPRIYCVGPLIDGADPAWPPLSRAVSSVAQVPDVVRALNRDRVDLIKAYVGVSHPVLERLVEEGHKVSLRVIIDQWQRNGSPDLVADGIYGFAHLPTRKLTSADVELMARPLSRKRGTPVLQISLYGDDGGLRDQGSWMPDQHGKWCREAC